MSLGNKKHSNESGNSPKKVVETAKKPKSQANIFSTLREYRGLIFLLIILGLVSNGLILIVPKLISSGIDKYSAGTLVISHLFWVFALVVVGIFLFTYLQTIVQTFVSEKVARDYREKLSVKISELTYQAMESANPSRLLTNLTSDINAIKMFISQAVVQGVSSIVIIIGASILLLSIDAKLGGLILLMIPIIVSVFFLIFKKAKVLFTKTREVIDWLNKVISESILGSAIIRVLNIQKLEGKKFSSANAEARDIGLKIVKLFAIMIPVISLVANLATLTILVLGGHYVIEGTMSLGDFAAFLSYVSLLIFPIIIIGFISNLIAQASASYTRIYEVLSKESKKNSGTVEKEILGKITFRNVSLKYGEKEVLKDINFELTPKSKTAIIGPTAAGKTQILYLLTNLIPASAGEVLYDDTLIQDYQTDKLHEQIGLVFQDSIIFNLSIRENIAFNTSVTESDLAKAIETAGLTSFIESLPEGLETVVSERGGSLSGGQKQRIMLARALALNPKVLLLDDFTARVDRKTETEILSKLEKNYPACTLVSVTQKIASVEHYDKLIVLMEGEIVATGTHAELLQTSPEYVQIYNSQRSTNHYELQS